MNARSILAGLVAAWVAATPAMAVITVETVPVGNTGNVGEWSGSGVPGGAGPDRICGAVDYAYDMGTFEVTAGQYTAFLNAVAATDTFGLYNPGMGNGAYACGIQRTGSPGSYAYAVTSDWTDRPVAFASWGDAARFANWMHHGQPTGLQGPNTTETGSYTVNGALTDAELAAITREPDASWVIPTEDEWYKAAYHHNNGPTADYFDYPTTHDAIPSNDLLSPDPGNNANFFDGTTYTIGSPYWRTAVGAFNNSESPYGTFDQGGNVWEWNEAVFADDKRGLRGGSFINVDAVDLHAGRRRADISPSSESGNIGFRLAYLPEPGVLTLLALGLLTLPRRPRRD